MILSIIFFFKFLSVSWVVAESGSHQTKYTFLVRIYFTANWHQSHCEAVIVSNDLVLTSAQCCEVVGDAFVVYGDTNHTDYVNGVNSKRFRVMRVAQRFMHDEYRELSDGTYLHDLCFMKLGHELASEDRRRIIRVSLEKESMTDCEVMGWGNLMNDTMQHVLQVEKVHPQECRNGRALCLKLGSNCRADGGSPIVCTDADGNRAVYGIDSYYLYEANSGFTCDNIEGNFFMNLYRDKDFLLSHLVHSEGVLMSNHMESTEWEESSGQAAHLSATEDGFNESEGRDSLGRGTLENEAVTTPGHWSMAIVEQRGRKSSSIMWQKATGNVIELPKGQTTESKDKSEHVSRKDALGSFDKTHENYMEPIENSEVVATSGGLPGNEKITINTKWTRKGVEEKWTESVTEETKWEWNDATATLSKTWIGYDLEDYEKTTGGEGEETKALEEWTGQGETETEETMAFSKEIPTQRLVFQIGNVTSLEVKTESERAENASTETTITGTVNTVNESTESESLFDEATSDEGMKVQVAKESSHGGESTKDTNQRPATEDWFVQTENEVMEEGTGVNGEEEGETIETFSTEKRTQQGKSKTDNVSAYVTEKDFEVGEITAEADKYEGMSDELSQENPTTKDREEEGKEGKQPDSTIAKSSTPITATPEITYDTLLMERESVKVKKITDAKQKGTVAVTALQWTGETDRESVVTVGMDIITENQVISGEMTEFQTEGNEESSTDDGDENWKMETSSTDATTTQWSESKTIEISDMSIGDASESYEAPTGKGSEGEDEEEAVGQWSEAEPKTTRHRGMTGTTPPEFTDVFTRKRVVGPVTLSITTAGGTTVHESATGEDGGGEDHDIGEIWSDGVAAETKETLTEEEGNEKVSLGKATTELSTLRVYEEPSITSGGDFGDGTTTTVRFEDEDEEEEIKELAQGGGGGGEYGMTKTTEQDERETDYTVKLVDFEAEKFKTTKDSEVWTGYSAEGATSTSSEHELTSGTTKAKIGGKPEMESDDNGGGDKDEKVEEGQKEEEDEEQGQEEEEDEEEKDDSEEKARPIESVATTSITKYYKEQTVEDEKLSTWDSRETEITEETAFTDETEGGSIDQKPSTALYEEDKAKDKFSTVGKDVEVEEAEDEGDEQMSSEWPNKDWSKVAKEETTSRHETVLSESLPKEATSQRKKTKTTKKYGIVTGLDAEGPEHGETYDEEEAEEEGEGLHELISTQRWTHVLNQDSTSGKLEKQTKYKSVEVEKVTLESGYEDDRTAKTRVTEEETEETERESTEDSTAYEEVTPENWVKKEKHSRATVRESIYDTPSTRFMNEGKDRWTDRSPTEQTQAFQVKSTRKAKHFDESTKKGSHSHFAINATKHPSVVGPKGEYTTSSEEINEEGAHGTLSEADEEETTAVGKENFSHEWSQGKGEGGKRKTTAKAEGGEHSGKTCPWNTKTQASCHIATKHNFPYVTNTTPAGGPTRGKWKGPSTAKRLTFARRPSSLPPLLVVHDEDGREEKENMWYGDYSKRTTKRGRFSTVKSRKNEMVMPKASTKGPIKTSRGPTKEPSKTSRGPTKGTHKSSAGTSKGSAAGESNRLPSGIMKAKFRYEVYEDDDAPLPHLSASSPLRNHIFPFLTFAIHFIYFNFYI